MNEYICVICKAVIPASTIEKRHYSPAQPMPPLNEMVCSKKCGFELRHRNGFYQQMSHTGRDARSKAVAQSNRDHPRRKKH